jgi:flagellar basal-body rod protein FlgC
MIFSVGSSLSALKAFGVKMGVSADNVANVETEGYKKRRAVFKEGPNNDVQVAVTQPETSGPVIAEVKNGQITEKELSNVDLAEEIPQAILTQSGFEANLKTLQAWSEMTGTVIDMFE